MRVPFVKMEGAGNDYVYFDAFAELPLARIEAAVPRIADRHYGVGGDGVILVGPSRTADCRMTMYNADGSRGAMCGNGLRCVALLARQLQYVRADTLTIETDAGLRQATILEQRGATARVAVDLGEVTVAAEPRQVAIEGREWSYWPGEAGNPHAVLFVDGDVDRAPVAELGAAMQRLPAFSDGVNVEFVAVQADGSLSQRTFERGSGETLACGSGAAVAAVAAIASGRVPGPRVTVRLRGGELIFARRGPSLVMEGPARTVFHGEIVLADP